MATRFYATEVLPSFREHVVDQPIFVCNHVEISMRVRVYKNDVYYIVKYYEDRDAYDAGYSTVTNTDTLAQALILAEDKQLVIR